MAKSAFAVGLSEQSYVEQFKSSTEGAGVTSIARQDSEAVLFVDWLNLSIRLKAHQRSFGPHVVAMLQRLARREADEGDYRLVKAHYVAENFGDGVLEAIDSDLTATAHKTRTAKEQADLLIAVLAMDHLHLRKEIRTLFLIATGDQDFVPLIERILIERDAEVLLIAASRKDLASEYRAIVAQHNIRLICLVEDDLVAALPATDSLGEVSLGVAVLLRLVFEGGVLGGNQDRNVAKLKSYRITSIAGGEEEKIAAWVNACTQAEMRRVAVPQGGKNRHTASTRRRTSLKFDDEGSGAALWDMDWILRRCDPRRPPISAGELGVGRFTNDDGSRVSAAIEAMEQIGWLTRLPNGTLENHFTWTNDGFIEPLQRVIASVQVLSHQAQATGVSRDKLFRALSSTPIGASHQRRGGQVARELLEFAQRVGVVDRYPHSDGGYLLGAVPRHPLVRHVNETVGRLKKLMPHPGDALPEHEVLASVRDAEGKSPTPLFGFDVKDRRACLRVLSRAGVIERKDVDGEYRLRLRHNAWVQSMKVESF